MRLFFFLACILPAKCLLLYLNKEKTILLSVKRLHYLTRFPLLLLMSPLAIQRSFPLFTTVLRWSPRKSAEGGGGLLFSSSYLTKCIKSRTWLVAHMGFLAGCHWWCPRHPSISFAHCLAITNLPLAELLGETYWTICKSSIFLQSHITCQSNVHGLFLPPRWNRLIQRSGSSY